ncbi:MAG: S-methyl-5-thioribose-1-phosphate isomerase [Phycisphaeraceae bacterium]
MNDVPQKLEQAHPTLEWIGETDGYLRLIDQTKLPGQLVFLDCRDVQSVWDAIKRLSVRGAPAIGVAAAYGCVIAAQQGDFARGADYLATSRPTAVNLFWAIARMKSLQTTDITALLAEARRIHAEDAAMCRAIGQHAMKLIEPNAGVLTHCNAGALATAGIGTATAGMYLAHAAGTPFTVYADETRPLLQGARLTAWELGEAGVAVKLICDSMAAQLMHGKKINLVITGADRIAANGDAANKVGTYSVAIAAKYHHIPFYVAAPSSTFDLNCPTGDDIPIEQRNPSEVKNFSDTPTAPPGTQVENPAFDVTPASLITGIITEHGLIQPVNKETVSRTIQ